MNRFAGRLFTVAVVLCCFAGISRAQVLMSHPTPITQSPANEPPPKNLLTLAELNTLDAKYHRELDAAREAFDKETFGDAEQGFAQLIQEVEGTIKRIAASTLPKNGFFMLDGVKTPATVQAETALFTRTLDKAKRGKDSAGILRNVTDTQKQAMELMSAGKYPEDRDAWRKSLQALAENRSQLDDSTFQFFSARSENGMKASSSEFWGAKFRTLRDKYNRTTDEPKLSPEEIHAIIKAVADEITTQGYMDAVKYPDMPDDARALFNSLLSAANQYLAAQ